MKPIKWMMTLMALVIGIVVVASPVSAGSKQRHRWEGVAIGVGAAILGHALYQHHHNAMSAPTAPAPSYRRDIPPQHHGHWEWQDSWVSPTYEKVWNPGHYNRKGRWVPGHWIEVQTSEGYWTKERVWVADNHAPY